MHKLADVSFWITQKPLYITLSNLLRAASHYFQAPFVFDNFLLKGTGFNRKSKVNFFKTFWKSPFKISYFQKNFLHAMALLGSLPELKTGLAFGAHFLCPFSIKMFLI